MSPAADTYIGTQEDHLSDASAWKDFTIQKWSLRTKYSTWVRSYRSR